MKLTEALSDGKSVEKEQLKTRNFYPITTDNENLHLMIRPTFLTVGLSYTLAALMTILATVILANLGGGIILVLGACLSFFSLPIYQHIRWSNIHYTLTSTKIEIEHGLLKKYSHSLLLWHIQNVTVNESLLERVLGVGDLLIDSANASDKMTLESIPQPRRYAGIILDQLSHMK